MQNKRDIPEAAIMPMASTASAYFYRLARRQAKRAAQACVRPI
jgi:hypothetical protein